MMLQSRVDVRHSMDSQREILDHDLLKQTFSNTLPTLTLLRSLFAHGQHITTMAAPIWRQVKRWLKAVVYIMSKQFCLLIV